MEERVLARIAEVPYTSTQSMAFEMGISHKFACGLFYTKHAFTIPSTKGAMFTSKSLTPPGRLYSEDSRDEE